MTGPVKKQHTAESLKRAKTVKIVIVLVVVCTVTALLLSVINMLTERKIADNLRIAEGEAIEQVWNSEGVNNVEYSALDGVPDSVKAVYAITLDGVLAGWCVSVSPSGFGGNIDMVVGVDTDGKIVGIEITALSETPGLGSRVAEEGYLVGYVGLSTSLTLGEDVDAISGATISSRSVLDGVNRATEALVGMELIRDGGESRE